MNACEACACVEAVVQFTCCFDEGDADGAARWFAPNLNGGNLRNQLNLHELGDLAARYSDAVLEMRKVDVAKHFNQPLVALAFRTLEAHRTALFGQTRYARLPAADAERDRNAEDIHA